MRKLVVTTAMAVAILSAGALVWNANAQASLAAAIIGSANKNFTPIEKAEPAAALPARSGAAGRADAGAIGANLTNSKS